MCLARLGVRCNKAGCTSLGWNPSYAMSSPLLDYYLALAGWLAQAEIKLVKRRGKPDARRYGGTGRR